MIPSPVILLPSDGKDYTTDTPNQLISGTTVVNTKRIEVNGSVAGVNYTPGESVWSFSVDLRKRSGSFSFVAVEEVSNNLSSPSVITVSLLKAEDFITVSPPTGVKLKRSSDVVEIINAQNPETQVLGYNYYVSSESGGGTSGYSRLNTELVTESTFFEDSVEEIGRSVDESGNIRTVTITEELTRSFLYSFNFTSVRMDELVDEGKLPEGTSFDDRNRFFYVITAVIFDPIFNRQTESVFSSELEGSPITISTEVQTLPQRTQSDIILSVSRKLLEGNSAIDTKPGTVLRDTLDPITEETARIYIIQDYLHQSLSVRALLKFDDEDQDGESDEVALSEKKQALRVALNLPDDAAVQSIIDSQFEDLASNANVSRKGSTSASGRVLFYIEEDPLRDMTVTEGGVISTLGDIDQGELTKDFRILATKTLPLDEKDSFYNAQTSRYELEVDVEASNPGEDGNTNANTIVTVDSGVDSDFRVENPNPIRFGEDEEINRKLAARIELAFASVDTGTEGGYARTALEVRGVRKSRVEKAGDPLMVRDYDNIRKEHIGGKVDVYIQGNRPQQVSDQIAFSFESIGDTPSGPVGETFAIDNVSLFQFRSINPRVSATTPIFDVRRVRNVTRAQDYDLTGNTIIGDGNVINLNPNLAINSEVGLASLDSIKVDYSFRGSDIFVLNNQPIIAVVSIVGDVSGPLTSDNYELVKIEDPLNKGNSTIASDGVRIKYANGLPLSEFQTITDEIHTMLVDVEEPLDKVGSDPESVVITNDDKSTTYTRNKDYIITSGTTTEPTTIRIQENGGITNGQVVLISYQSIENFLIEYSYESLAADVQELVNERKHAAADAIAKQSVENSLDFIITVVPKDGANEVQLTSKIRTAISNYVSQLEIGVDLHQSDVVRLIENIQEVNFVVIPFQKMVKANNSLIVRDNIGGVQFQVFNEGLNVTSFITAAPSLTFNTSQGGGSENLHRGIFEDREALILVEDPLLVSEGHGRGFIQADGNIIVSTKDGQLPDSKSYEVSYTVYGEEGAKDITVADIEHLRVGTLSIIYGKSVVGTSGL